MLLPDAFDYRVIKQPMVAPAEQEINLSLPELRHVG